VCTILVSSCLLGLKTRYDGSDNYSEAVSAYIRNNNLIPIPICPEQLAGLATPRPKCWFTKGDGKAVIEGVGSICDEVGINVTNNFLHGARETLKIAKITQCKQAILQQRSPSCGSQKIYLHEELIDGIGVTTALLSQHGVKIVGSDDLK